MRPETVIICQKDGQWGILFECGDFVTYRHPVYRNGKCLVCGARATTRELCTVHYQMRRPLLTKAPVSKYFTSKAQVHRAIENIAANYWADYNEPLPWIIEEET